MKPITSKINEINIYDIEKYQLTAQLANSSIVFIDLIVDDKLKNGNYLFLNRLCSAQ